MFNLFAPTVRTTIKFLQILKVNVNDVTVNNSLQNHPDWPSLLCVADNLSKWHIPNAAGSISPDDIDELPTPFIASIDENVDSLSIVLEVSDTTVSIYYGSKKKVIIEDKEKFIKRWDGIYLIAEPNEESGENKYEEKKRKVVIKRLTPLAALAISSSLILLLNNKLAIQLDSSLSKNYFGFFNQIFLSLVGVFITGLLVWYEIDSNNPFLKKVCSGLVKSDCNAILASKQSKIFSWLSWSEVGLFFFAGNLFALLFGSNKINESVTFVSWISIFALPYTIFSIYYQAKVVKQWCLLCLCVQGLLLLGFINIMINGLVTYHGWPNTTALISVLLLYSFTPFMWFSAKPYLLRLQEGKNVYRQYVRLKFDTALFSFLLKKQKRIEYATDAIGINLGNPNAENTIVKVCNVYCNPCSRAHTEIEKLLDDNKNLKVKIIYTFKNQDSDPAIKPTSHLLAIAKQNNLSKLQDALNDWHLADDKNYNVFAARYPLKSELLNQKSQIDAMDTWCKHTGITHTPTIFINGYQLPDDYSIEDLHYFLLDELPLL